MAGDQKAAQSDLITLEVAGRLLMISSERVRQLVRAGYIPLPQRGRTTIVGAVQGYIRYLKEDARNNGRSTAAVRAVDARAAEIELRVSERRRELIPLDEALLAMDLLVAKVAEELTGAPARITRDLALRRQIEADIHAAKVRIADALDGVKGFARTGREPDPAGAADDA